MNDYYEISYQEWLENYDENNPFKLHERGLISDDDLRSWLENDRIEKERQEKFNKRKRIAEIICKEHKN